MSSKLWFRVGAAAALWLALGTTISFAQDQGRGHDKHDRDDRDDDRDHGNDREHGNDHQHGDARGHDHDRYDDHDRDAARGWYRLTIRICRPALPGAITYLRAWNAN